MAFEAGTRLGPYEILSALGSGGMGEVYRARDTRLDRIVAIKVLSSNVASTAEWRQRFAREARAVAALTHRNICALYDFGTDGGVDYLVMEYLEGQTLADRLLEGTLPAGEVWRYAIEIAGALEHAHRRGIVHADLKPANVMVTRDGVKLLDFGVARPVLTAVGESDLPSVARHSDSSTANFTLIGTLHYLAPEQLTANTADTRTDVFAFGALVYEMATRRKLFDADTRGGVLADILSPEPPSVLEREPVDPASLNRFIARCLEKSPDERWQDAHDAKAALELLFETDSAAPMRPLAVRASRREVVAWLVALVLLGAAGISIAIARRAGNTAGASVSPVRFEITAPADTSLFSGGGVMALSPDGRTLAMIATPRGANALLWIRPLDALAASPVSGTDGASQPFWSPDSRFIAFDADGKLKKVEVATGDVQTICDVDAMAGTWNARDEILFKPTSGTGGIVRVSARGGRPVAVTTLETSRHEISHNWPSFLPDGRHFLYLVWSTQPEYAGVYVAAVDGRDRVRILSDISQAVYAQPGYVVFRRQQTVFAQPFDPRVRRLSGDPVPLASNIAFNPRTSRGVFSVSDSGVLAYRSADGALLTWFDRTGVPQGTLGVAGADRDPAISPDGKTVAVARLDPATATSDVWLIDALGNGARRFTFDPRDDASPVWSPDGSRVSFASHRSGKSEIFVRPSNGAAPEELLVSVPTFATPQHWSRDGMFLLFTRFDPRAGNDIWAVPLSGVRNPFPLVESPAEQMFAQLSPSGRWLAYASNESGAWEVYVTGFRDRGAKRRISTRGGTEPKWRGDGRELYYLAADGRLMAADVQESANLDVRPPVPLFETHTVTPVGSSMGLIDSNQYDVAPDGRRFLVSTLPSGSTKPITVLSNWPATLRR
jgi:Tol biopolymer transport system component